MLKKILCFCAIVSFINNIWAQDDAQMYASYKPDGEVGLSVGLSHYFGDLDANGSLRRPKFAAGAYYIKSLNNYIGIRVAADYAFLAYSDVYSDNVVQQRRNLSFNTSIWELSASGYFNFYRFIPGVKGYSFTPYVSLGIGVFSYDPYAYLQGVKYYLRPLGTEGQGSSLYPERKIYGSNAVCFPLTVGVKYALSSSTNFFAEAGYRFTTTDYIDDVSTTYAGASAFPAQANGQPSVAYLLQDRSYETGTPIGIKGRQRGNSSQTDAYAILQVGLSFNISSYRCPKVK